MGLFGNNKIKTVLLHLKYNKSVYQIKSNDFENIYIVHTKKNKKGSKNTNIGLK